jgi:hypothetical protein
LCFLIYLEHCILYLIIIIDRIRKTKSILVAYLSFGNCFDLECPNFDSEKLGSQNEKKGVVVATDY